MNHDEYKQAVAKANERYKLEAEPINKQLYALRDLLDKELDILAKDFAAKQILDARLSIGDYVSFGSKTWEIVKFGTTFYSNDWMCPKPELRGMPFAYAVIHLRTKTFQKPRIGFKTESTNITNLTKIEVKK